MSKEYSSVDELVQSFFSEIDQAHGEDSASKREDRIVNSSASNSSASNGSASNSSASNSSASNSEDSASKRSYRERKAKDHASYRSRKNEAKAALDQQLDRLSGTGRNRTLIQSLLEAEQVLSLLEII